jgi:hypothetical protein
MKRNLLCALVLGLAGVLSAGRPVGVVTVISGKVSLFTAAATDKAKDLKLGQQLQDGDRLKTGANGRAGLVLTDGTQLKINYSTDITLREKDTKGKSSERGVGSIKLALGQLWAKVTKKNSRLEFDTPAAVAAVKGTEPFFEVSEVGDLCIKLREGKLDVANDLGGVSLGQLQQICLTKGQKPTDGMVQKWDGKGTFENELGKATSANVEIQFKDNDDQKTAGKIVLEYKK